MLSELDTSGGHIAVLLFLFLMGVLMIATGLIKGEDILMGAFGALVGYIAKTLQTKN